MARSCQHCGSQWSEETEIMTDFDGSQYLVYCHDCPKTGFTYVEDALIEDTWEKIILQSFIEGKRI